MNFDRRTVMKSTIAITTGIKIKGIEIPINKNTLVKKPDPTNLDESCILC